MKQISIKDDFSQVPNLRHCKLSEKSGEEFYHAVLNREFKRALDNKEKLVVDLDGTDGYASSFLDEAFGNLVYDFTLEIVKANVEIISLQEPYWKEMIEQQSYKEWEERRKSGQAPIVTAVHGPWYRRIGKLFELRVWESPA